MSASRWWRRPLPAILIALTPIFVALLSGPMIGERLTVWGWSGRVLASAGAALVILGQAGGLDLGVSSLLLLIAALAHAMYNVMAKSLVARYSPLQVASWSMWVGAVTSLPLLVGAPGRVAGAPWDAFASPSPSWGCAAPLWASSCGGGR